MASLLRCDHDVHCQSDSAHLERNSIAVRERRQTQRVRLQKNLQGEITVQQPLIVTEISARGMLIETDIPLALNSLHTFRLALRDSTIVVQGRLVHCHVHQVADTRLVYAAGVEFIGIPQRAAQAVMDFLAATTIEEPPQ